VFFSKSPRHIDWATARALGRQARSRATIVALSVDADDDTLKRIVDALSPDLMQLHGSETPTRVKEIRELCARPAMKAIGVATHGDLGVAQAYEGVADHLLNGEFPDWPDTAGELDGYDAKTCGAIMQKWEKFTHLGAIGPDMFYYSQDWNNDILGPVSDELMLAFAVYYFLDKEGETDYDILLTILAEANSQIASLLRFIIKLQKIWQSFLDGWNATVGPLVADINNLADDLTGGVLSEFGVVMDELKMALKAIVEEELLTFKDIFGNLNTCVQKGYGEKLFLWSDMSHYRRPSALCQSFVKQANLLAQQARDLAASGDQEQADQIRDRSQQFLAFALGYMTALVLHRRR